jgi:hypothetical protein
MILLIIATMHIMYLSHKTTSIHYMISIITGAVKYCTPKMNFCTPLQNGFQFEGSPYTHIFIQKTPNIMNNSQELAFLSIKCDIKSQSKESYTSSILHIDDGL